MSTIETENQAGNPEPHSAQPKGRHKSAQKPKTEKKTERGKKAASKPKAGGTNKKGEVIVLLKHSKGTTLAEIMKTTDWPPHTVRGFVSILDKKGGERIDPTRFEDHDAKKI